jgi:hypothetical protein
MDRVGNGSIGLCVEYVQEDGVGLDSLLPIKYSRKLLPDRQYYLPSCHSFGDRKCDMGVYCGIRPGQAEVNYSYADQ